MVDKTSNEKIKFFGFMKGSEEIVINVGKILFLSRQPHQNIITLVNHVSLEVTKEDMQRLYEIIFKEIK